MDRVDSGFYESCRSKAPEKEATTVHRSNTTPSRHRKSKNSSTEWTLNSRSVDMETRRPALEKRPIAQRRPSQNRRKSVASSENSTAKSRSRGYESKPSSRRTSCTIVDPSRPARHYRIKSSQTVPTTNQDIDDVLALHFRSCSLFQNPIYHSPPQSGFPSPTISRYGSGGLGVDMDIASTERTNPISSTMTAPAPHTSTDGINVVYDESKRKESEETMANTTMHWMSPSTRRREYEKIDRANNGVRGFLRRVVPRCVSGPPPPRFYEKDHSDVGSVRRYRMDVSDDEVDEKSTSSLRLQGRRLEKSTTNTTVKKRWVCF